MALSGWIGNYIDLLSLYPSVKQQLSAPTKDAKDHVERTVRATLYRDLAIRSLSASGSNERLRIGRDDVGVFMPLLANEDDIVADSWDLPVAELVHRCPFLIGKVARRLRGLRLGPYTRAVVWRVALADEGELDSLRRTMQNIAAETTATDAPRLAARCPVSNLIESMADHLLSSQVEKSWGASQHQGGILELKPVVVRVMNLAHWLLKQHDAELLLAVIVVCAGCQARLPHVAQSHVDNRFQSGVRTAAQARASASPNKRKAKSVTNAGFEVDVPLTDITRDDLTAKHNINPRALPELTYVELLHLAVRFRSKCKELLSDECLARVPFEAMPQELWDTIANLLNSSGNRLRNDDRQRRVIVARRLLSEHARVTFTSLPITCAMAFWDAVCFASRRVASLSRTEYNGESQVLPLVPIIHAMGLGDLLVESNLSLALGEASDRCVPSVFFRSLEIVCRDFADAPALAQQDAAAKNESVQVEPTEEQAVASPAEVTEGATDIATAEPADKAAAEREEVVIKPALKSGDGASTSKEKKVVSLSGLDES